MESSRKRKCDMDSLNEKQSESENYKMYGWGSTIHGELSLGGIEAENILIPREVDFLEAGNISRISCGDNYTMVTTDDGNLYSCGNNDYGQLGHSKTRKRLQLVTCQDTAVKFRKIACGSSHCLATNECGEIYCWGSNEKSQLGLDNRFPIECTPRKIKLNVVIVQIACGVEHSIALSNTGEIYGWGSNTEGQLALGSKIDYVPKPTKIPNLTAVPIIFIACGGYHTIAISNSGVVFAWGRNTFGQLGLSDTVSRSLPCQLRTLRNSKVCYAACGEEFSVFLTLEGGVFTCGAGMYGQLGHGTNTSEVLPRQVMELMGSRVTQISCGRKHTLALVPSRGRIYAWGLGGVGQLGNGTAQSATTPQVVLGPWELNESSPVVDPCHSPQIDYVVKDIFCGGDHCFATIIPKKDNMESNDYKILGSSPQLLTLTEQKLVEYQKTGADAITNNNLMMYLEIVLKNQACINASFLYTDKHYGCSIKNHGIDIEQATKLFGIISEIDNHEIQKVIFTCITEILIPSLIVSPPDVETLRIYLTLPLYHNFTNLCHYKTLQGAFCKAFISLKEEARHIISLWWSETPTYYFERLVRIYKAVMLEFLKDSVQNKCIIWNEYLKYSLDMLAILHKRNNTGDLIVPHKTFYMPEIKEYVDINSDYLSWLIDEEYYYKIYICNYAFVFDAEAKTTLLQLDQNIQMRDAMQEAATRAVREMIFFRSSNCHHSQFLTLVISRENMVVDTLVQLPNYSTKELKKPLRVKFQNEEAEDVGGVKKEFFLLLWRELLDGKYGMFKEYEENRILWFNSESLEDTNMYMLIGLLCGLAMYNQTIVHLPFPTALYKKLLKETIDLSDMEELSPIMARGMQNLLDYNDPDFEDVFCLNFEITTNVFDQQKVYELIPGGKDIPVTLKNRKQYVQLYIDFIFNKSVKKQYTAFESGFQRVCTGRILQLFHSRELMSLLIGNENYDWEEFEKHAIYKNDYSKDNLTIVFFWQVFHELSLEEKKKFLLFLTGTDRIPIQGMKGVKITIQPVGDERFLPVAHTCFNLLDLPRYNTREKLKYKLLQAIQHNQGFSLV